jgi:phage baseplate assembly protein W
MADERFKGLPYPIVEHPRGLFRTQMGTAQIRSDLLFLLQSNFGERVMLPQFGTNLKEILFEPNDEVAISQTRSLIISAIQTWEPRVVIEELEIGSNLDILETLSPEDPRTQDDHVLAIKIRFFDPEEIEAIQELVLEIPLAA